VIRTLIAHDRALFRGALAFVLSNEDDIEVIAELDRTDANAIATTVAAERPDVTIVDLDLFGMDGLGEACTAYRSLEGCRLLVLADLHRARALAPVMAKRPPGVGFLTKDGKPGRMVDAVRRMAAGEPVIDADLVAAAVGARSPLTPRETEVLAAVAGGGPLYEVAERLRLSPGTVRNHLSRIIAKTGGRTRIEAISLAQRAGWI
jgi:two-component system response regulator DesR